jgi:uncharacterized protein
MQLYAGSSADFIQEATLKRVASRLGDAFYDYFRYRASASEFASWQNSLLALAQQFRYCNMLDQGVVLELQLPYSSARLDCLVFGMSPHDRAAQAVLIELKQWTEVAPSEWDGCVETFVGGAVRKVLHPSVQASRYAQYLEDVNPGFDRERSGVQLLPCSWLHNMHPGAAGPLRATEFTELLHDVPLFVSADADRFGTFLQERVGSGDGVTVMDRTLLSPIAPSRKLLDYTAKMVAGEATFRLVDEQVVAYNAVLSLVRRARRKKGEKSVLVVTGGPGTGKSLIALNLLGTLSRMGLNAQHATGSKAFTQNIWRVLGSRSKALVKFFNNFTDAPDGGVDVLLADEAHRIRATSNHRFTRADKRSTRTQIEELISVANVSVFFIDDHQAVRPGEVGSTALIHEACMAAKARYNQVDLRTQFRCAGSDEYIDWLDQLLEIRKTGTTQLEAAAFDFRLVESPEALDALVTERLAQGASARLTAGFCWPWSKPLTDGSLVDDVIVGNFRRPWNAKEDARKLARGIPLSQFWATDPGGIGQVGCVYTAQGFEFDYAGVIWGNDLVIRNGEWVGQPSASRDHVVKTRAGARFTDCVKNTYRVLLTRGLKGCYVHILDLETRDYVAARARAGALPE